jgi:hypothetical protein
MYRRSKIDEFIEQLAELDMDQVVKRYALRRARHVAHADPRVDDLYPRELLQDVLTDTLLGVLHWDPTRKLLRQHVMDSMKSRSRHDYERAVDFPHFRIDDDRWMAAAESTVACRTEDAEEVMDEHINALGDRAVGDDDVLLLLDAYRRRITKKCDVMNATRLSPLRYDAARKRMLRLRDDLPRRSAMRARRPR